MAFRADLTVEDKTYRVLYCHHALHRDVDVPSGRLTSRTRGGTITLEVESTDDIFFWTRIGGGTAEPISGQIEFKKRDEEVKMKVLKFTDAFILDHEETFHAIGSTPMTIKFSLSARMLTMEGSEESCEFTNEWPV